MQLEHPQVPRARHQIRQQPGTFQAMTRGTVEKRWAWTHHPAWYRAVTGRDPRADYKRALERSNSGTP